MDPRSKAGGADLIEAIDGSHLHWLDFRVNVLLPFQIQCSSTLKVDQLPTTFVARLQACQNNLDNYDRQRQAWRLDVASGRGLSSPTIFPPNLISSTNGGTNILRCMLPRLSREGLPPRLPSGKNFLYELPTAKPLYICGFNMDMFDKTEQTQFSGALSATGTVVDFDKAEVHPSKILCCPFLAFEVFKTNTERHIESARNLCAITGAQCLRGQQQLFHKAFGLQTVEQPPITFTCALNNEHAVINYHYVDVDGSYTMAALCKFNLDIDEHYNVFQVWIEAIESWASLYLLPRIQGAIHQVVQSNPSPPPSPIPTTTSYLSIDTKSVGTSTILNILRQSWPMIPWHRDLIGETPINSSIAHCGTPLQARQIRSLALPRPSSNDYPSSLEGVRPGSSVSQRFSDILSPICTDIPLSARSSSRPSIHARRFSTASATNSQSEGSTTPYSPCRPPSLSPCTPGPDTPISSKSPMLVLQRRLDVAADEIQELRIQVEDLQGQLSGRIGTVEQRLELMMEKRNSITKHYEVGGVSGHHTISDCVEQSEALVEEDIKTPVARSPQHIFLGESMHDASQPDMTATMPGFLPQVSAEEQSHGMAANYFTEEDVVRCLAMIMHHGKACLVGILVGVTLLCCIGQLNWEATFVEFAMYIMSELQIYHRLWHAWSSFERLCEAAQHHDAQRSGSENLQNLSLATIAEKQVCEEDDVSIFVV